MSLSILNNPASLAAQNQLSITNSNLQSTLFQLSSGTRINSGADDAAGLAIADGLHANITALTQSARNAHDGVGQLQVADGALAQVTTLLNRAVTLATESSTGTVSDSQRAALDSEFTQIKAEIDRIGSNTTYNGTAVFAGTGTNYSQVQVAASSAANAPGLATSITGDLKLQFGGAGTTYTYGASNGDATVGDLINDINSKTSTDGFVAGLDGSGNLVVTDTFNRGTTTNGLADAGSSDLTYGSDTSAASIANSTNSSSLGIYLSDSTTTGSGTISVNLNAFSTSNMNGGTISGDNLASKSAAQTALTNINNSIAQVAALRGQLGAGINRLQSASNVINSQVQNLTTAEDGIRAADIPSTVASLTKYSILEQTGVAALSQANQMQQLVLSLLK